MQVISWKKISPYAGTILSVMMISSCSSMSPEMQESWEGIRGAMPKALRGNAIPLEEYPLPSLQGSWVDDGFPELSIRFVQSGNSLTIYRDGERYEIVVRERVKATLTGRAVKAKYINDPPNDIRPTSGSCSGSVSKDSQRVSLTCQYRGEILPLNFSKKS
jgi:hypothetical protein